MKFTLVIPTYNEAAIIRETLSIVADSFESLSDVDWRVVVADNASTDGTANIVDALANPRMSSLRLPEKGRARAIRAGFEKAGGGIVAFTDADLSVSPEEVIKGLRVLMAGESDIVIGTRFSGKDAPKGRSWKRNLSSYIFILLARMIVGLRATDSQCPLKMATERATPVMLATKDPTWFSDLEFIVLAERLGLRITELPIAWNEERFPDRKTKLMIVHDGIRAVIAMFKIRFRLNEQLRILLPIVNK